MGGWFEQAKQVPVVEIAYELGLGLGRDGKSFGPCPSCGEEFRGNDGRDRRPRCVIVAEGKGWHCYSNGTLGCGACGDGLHLVAWALAGTRWGKNDADTTSKVRAWFVGRSLCDGPLVRSSPSFSLHSASGRPAAPQARPDAQEMASLWEACGRVDEDPEVAAWLDRRGLDSKAIADRNLARALPFDGALPSWARFKGRSWRLTGHRLVFRAWEPALDGSGNLRLASIRARCVRLCESRDKAAAAATGAGSGSGLVLSPSPERPLADGEARKMVTLVEGEPDYLAWALKSPELRGALFGTWSGSAQPPTAALVPARWVVALAHHADPGGEQQALAWNRELRKRGVQCARCPPRVLEKE